MKFYIVSAIAILSSLINENSCCKEKEKEPEMPSATNIGANTFGCYVNGELFVRALDYGYSYITSLTASCNKNQLVIIAISTNGNSIQLQDSVVELGKKVQLKRALFRYKNSYDDTYYLTDESELILTCIDVPNSIISGLFSFKAKNESGDSITITDGRFDIRDVAYFYIGDITLKR